MKRIHGAVIAGVLAVLTGPAALAQSADPAKPIALIVPFAAGGDSDMERITGWSALMGPPGMAKAAVDKWAEVLGTLASDPDWLAGNARFGGIPAIRSSAETTKFVREQYELYERLATALGIRE